MAQNFRRYIARNVGTSAVTLHTVDSFDTIIGIALANTTSSEIKVDVYVNDGSNDYYLIKMRRYSIRWYFTNYRWRSLNTSFKVVTILKVVSDTNSSLDVWVSVVDDAISD